MTQTKNQILENQLKTGLAGRIHNLESGGTVDGPGIRFVIFTQGCPLRCQYCHNPDSQPIKSGKIYQVEELVEEVSRYKNYMRFSGGGVTISGGEPLLQPKFVANILKRCKEEGIHTTLDTSGFVKIEKAQEVLEYTDLVLLDIKAFDHSTYKEVTGVPLDPCLNFARHLSEINKPTWLRFVLVPGLTDKLDEIRGLADFAAGLGNIERVEILPFHQMGEFKWQELGWEYKLSQTNPPTKDLLEKVKKIFRQKGLTTV